MDALTLSCLFIFFLFLSLPVGIAIGAAIIIFMQIYPVSGYSFIHQNMYSAMNSFPLMAVPFFMLTGSIMDGGGLSKRLVAFANTIVGNMTSGLAIVTITACMFFGAISGSAPATLAGIGIIMVPAMLRANYGREFSVGLVTTAGGLGVIIPPSIPLVIYGVGTMTSIGDLFLAGIGPGILVGALLMLTAFIIGRRRNYVGSGERVRLEAVLRSGWEAKWAVFMPVIILGGIYGGIFTPTEAAVVGTVYSLFVGFFIYRELTIPTLFKILSDNASLFGASFLILGFATSLSYLVSITMLPARISDALALVSSNQHVIMLIMLIFLLIIGMLLDATSANLIFSPLLLSVVQPLGVDAVHFGIVVTVALAVGFVTPPMATNLFLASSLFSMPMQQIARGAAPFLAAMIAALILIAYFPAISLFIVHLAR
ncbi:MAG: TRAP transporter large permease [Synergistaceae bacterium]|jgi:C4-dicarboxylate transporter DctM subunit|nr:TRAP transporter large permease [Synergistaceae bacterium]